MLGDHRFVEFLVQTGAEKMFLGLARKKRPEFGSVCWLPPPRSFAVELLPNRYLPGLGAGSVVRYLCLNLAGMDRLESGIEEGMSLRLHRGTARVHSVLQRCAAQGVSLMGPNKLFL